MSAKRLETIRVEKPWGRGNLWPGFDDPAPGDEPIGEIWFDAPKGEEPELLVKYLFTSERLSIQVHPNDDQARAAGYARGKEEVWIVLDAEPDSTIALGLKMAVSHEELRAAAISGDIEELMDWRPVKAGDVIYSPAGTVHAIGAGITLIEVQQNVDLTYRLYDYGRPRELHLDEGIAVSDPVPYAPYALGSRAGILTEGGKFVVEKWQDSASVDTQIGWFIPVKGSGKIDGAPWRAGECWMTHGKIDIELDQGSEALFAYPGPIPRA